ncbi:hypothetical protein KSP40_PGU004899 [Platanthera guangdongensis]|uniref:MORF/ORRM1/DAG-like MORF domain-containing protein n=1 Tax=Platanthera guangdongensis TaxID=2320717 RepID=A0ABR2N348_9ASPA
MYRRLEEAKKNMYAFSTTTYTGFQCTVSEETSEKFKGKVLSAYNLRVTVFCYIRKLIMQSFAMQDCREFFGCCQIPTLMSRTKTMEVSYDEL